MSVMVERERKPATEVSVRDFRLTMADVLNDAAAYGKITYVTSRGRRIAAVVPVLDADEILEREGLSPPPPSPPTRRRDLLAGDDEL